MLRKNSMKSTDFDGHELDMLTPTRTAPEQTAGRKPYRPATGATNQQNTKGQLTKVASIKPLAAQLASCRKRKI
jgi:hypothetical protein